jgi:signal transduction histidine kinase
MNPGEAIPQVRRLKKTLRQRTVELAASQRLRKRGIARCDALEDALRKKAGHDAKLLSESDDLRQCLRNLTRQTISAQEDERATISRKLHDGVAQVLLGIQVRLVALKKEAALNTAGLKKEIASTQRLVEKSARTLERFAGKLS